VDDIVFPMEAKLNVGDRFKLGPHPTVQWPFNLFTYEVVSIDGDKANLKIVDHEAADDAA
jgi:hypothetical protein